MDGVCDFCDGGGGSGDDRIGDFRFIYIFYLSDVDGVAFCCYGVEWRSNLIQLWCVNL